jgi:phage host-nuclease inhibitor protein Gam
MRDIEAWAAGHPEQFLDRKSIDLLHGTIGFRTSTPRVVIPRNMDEDELSVRLMLAGMSEYVRVRRELDRQAVLAAAASDKYQDVQDRIGEFGVHVVQSERFFIDVRQEDAVGE